MVKLAIFRAFFCFIPEKIFLGNQSVTQNDWASALDKWCGPQVMENYENYLKIIIKYPPYLSRNMTKSTKWLRPAKTQISRVICPVWSESSLSTWRNLGSLATYWTYSKDWLDWADTQADLSLRWAHTHFVGFLMSCLLCYCYICNIYVVHVLVYFRIQGIIPHHPHPRYTRQKMEQW